MRFMDVSPWVTQPDDLTPSLKGVGRADVVIIGGGYTGLSAALRLREQGVDVALLEKDYCGMGASGRNAGHLTPTIGKDVFTCIKTFGEERGVALARFGDKAVEFTQDFLRDRDIDCDYAPTGNIIAGVHGDQYPLLEQSAAIARKVGIHMTFLDEAAMRGRGLPASFRFGILETVGGHLHPGKYVAALRRLVIAAGVRVYENSAVQAITEGPALKVCTATGEISAEKVLIATNAYTGPTLGLMQNRLLPVRVSQFMTAPLSERQLAAIGWPNREGIYTAHELLENYRLTADNRLIGGSKWVHYAFGNRLAEGNRPALFRRLAGVFRRRFPELHDLEILGFWGGWIAVTLDFLPLFGVSDQNERIHYSLGYNGHGVAQATMMGAASADAIMGRPWDELAVLQRRLWPLPPEPLRWLAYQALIKPLEWKDALLDRKIG